MIQNMRYFQNSTLPVSNLICMQVDMNCGLVKATGKGPITKPKPQASPSKKEPFLDFEKDIDLGDNLILESYMNKKQLEEWKELKDEDDYDDFSN